MADLNFTRAHAIWDEGGSPPFSLLPRGLVGVAAFMEGCRARRQGRVTDQGPHLGVSRRTFQAPFMSNIILLNINTLNFKG